MSFSTALSGSTRPSELIRPPSSAAVTFLRCTDGGENGSTIFFIFAGVAASDPAKIGFDAQISA
jgi:hypothetical protein